MIKAGAAIGQGSREADLFNREFVQLKSVLAKIPILSGVLVEDVAAVNGAFTADHKLGRTPLGFIVVGRDANVQVWDDTAASQASTAVPSRVLYLQANGAANLTLWVF